MRQQRCKVKDAVNLMRANDSEKLLSGKGALVEAQEQSKGAQTKTASLEAS